MSDFWRLDATAQAALVREKSVFDRARAEASLALTDGPFPGVPFLLKHLLAERPWAGRWATLW